MAQTTGPTREELELPPPQTTGPTGGVRIDRDANFRQNCPFDNSELTTALQGVTWTDVAGGEVAPQILRSLSTVTVPQGTQPLSVVCDIRDAANAALRRDGWIATVQIPQQELTDRLQLQVVSARISELRITGDPGPYRDQIARQMAPLQQLSPLNERDAERILLNANDIPGLSMRLSLAPAGGEPGEVIGNLAVEYTPYAVFLNARNYNSKRIGRETLFGRFEYYGLTGLADLTYIGAQTTLDFEEQQIVQAGHEFGVGPDNVRIGASVTYAWSNPTIANLDLSTKTLIANLEASYPLVRSVNLFADASIGFDYVDQKTDVVNFPLSKDALRTLYVRGNLFGQRRRLDGSVFLSYSAYLEARRGLDIFGATEFGAFGLAETDGISASRPFGDSRAFVVRGGVDVTASLAQFFGVRARGEGQWTDKPLLNYDEFSIGNLTIGRGYDPGANSGDRAIGGAFEVTADPVQRPGLRAQLFGFYDVVKIENLDLGTPERSRTLESVGGGLRLFFGEGLRAEVAYAKPLDRALFNDTEKPPERVLFSITTKFPALFQ
ncbi:ShlB/FhaC/HecB family hemolysin secretion/activation protein [Tsuneonella dongtanensis]|uniref:ShlB/FhaC/HecB family hemolysin secretion/activation protein n=1 Tax=Tsuneonella dongtanensis TaxID=692370 RepID=UPI0008336248|nr:ShlB/FhaC/HecB family hemolysin secretion/activation protein [Tsuneonella dongtanensis]